MRAVALRDHIAETEDELNFLQGELITVLDSRGNGIFHVSAKRFILYFTSQEMRIEFSSFSFSFHREDVKEMKEFLLPKMSFFRDGVQL